MKGLARHRPALATVLDWEEEGQLPEVLDWAEEAAAHVTEGLIIIPKVPGLVAQIPRQVSGKRTILGYSVPTSYGASPLGLWELTGWPVHLLGGSPQRQMELWTYLRGICEVVSVDGSMTAQQARRCRFWSPVATAKGRWVQLNETGDTRPRGANLESFRLSLVNVRAAWATLTGAP